MKKLNLNDIDLISRLWGLDNSEPLVIDPDGFFIENSKKIDSGVFEVKDLENPWVIDRYTLIVSTGGEKYLSECPLPKIQFKKVFNKNNKDQSFYIIKNKDHSIRWMIPVVMATPNFLNFYNSPTFLSKIYKIIFKLIYLVKLQSLLFDTVTVSCQSSLERYVPRSLSYDSISVFTGTSGENRKIILGLIENNRPVHYVKIGISRSSCINIENESKILKRLALKEFNSFEHPLITDSVQDNSIIVSNIRPEVVVSNSSFSKRHAKFIYEIGKKYSNLQTIGSLVILDEIITYINSLKDGGFCDNGLDSNLVYRSVSRIDEIISNLKTDELVNTSISHGDFTPWNMFLGEEKLHVYDWELSREGIPILFDYFHFIYQSNILSGDNSIDTITHLLDETSQYPEMVALLKEFKINFKVVHALYLCHTIAYYLNLYTKQEPLHQQAHWLVTTWDMALSRINVIGKDTNVTKAY